MSIQDITIVITSFKSDEKIKDCLNSINSKCKVLLIENSNNIEFKKSIEKRVWLNTGHGHLGWTLSAYTAKSVVNSFITE